jgi:hypothetical protein
LKEEMGIIHECLSPFFSSLQCLRKDWGEILKSRGYSTVKGYFTTEYDKRHKLIEKFANVTTKRLQAIRRLDNAWKSLKKKDITNEMVKRLLSTRQNLSEEFYSEILAIIGPQQMSKPIAHFCLKHRRDPGEGTLPMNISIINAYVASGLYESKKEKVPVIKLGPDTQIAEKYERAVITLSHARSRIDTIFVLLRKFASKLTPEARGVIRMHLLKSCANFLDDTRSIDETWEMLKSISWTNVIPNVDKLNNEQVIEYAIHIRLMYDKLKSIPIETITLPQKQDAEVAGIIKKCAMAVGAISSTLDKLKK